MKVKYKIPATAQQGDCEIIGKSSFMESSYENALWEYNSMREHDCLKPLSQLPPGTKRFKILDFNDEKEKTAKQRQKDQTAT